MAAAPPAPRSDVSGAFLRQATSQLTEEEKPDHRDGNELNEDRGEDGAIGAAVKKEVAVRRRDGQFSPLPHLPNVPIPSKEYQDGKGSHRTERGAWRARECRQR